MNTTPFKKRQRTIAKSVVTLGVIYLLLRRRNKHRRWWVRPINKRRKSQGDYHNLIQEMRLGDEENFFNYTRMSVYRFDLLLSWVGPVIKKTSYREPIGPGERLALTLRHLAAGDSIPTLSYSFRVGKSTACKIINETCEALWTVLQPRVLTEPNAKDWYTISVGFQNTWNLPNCVGALDGKHVRIRAPYKSGSLYFNYKKTFSIVLFAICDHKYNFTYVDIGAYGSQSDGGVLRNSSFGHKLNNCDLNLPQKKPFPGRMDEKEHYFVGDEAFPLQMNVMRPFGGRNLPEHEKVYNYRLSRARRCIENAFGIMVARFRIFHSTIFKMPENVDKTIKACVCLHNFLKKQDELATSVNNRYCPPAFADDDVRGQFISGEWHKIAPANSALRPASELNRRIGTRNATNNATIYRNYIKEYVNSDEGSVSWQLQAINR